MSVLLTVALLFGVYIGARDSHVGLDNYKQYFEVYVSFHTMAI